MSDRPASHPDASDWIRIGQVGKTHGIKGEIRIYSLTDVADRLEGLSAVWWQHGNNSAVMERLQVESVRPAERFFLMRFKGYDLPEQVKKLSNGFLVIPRQERGQLPAGRYFIDDIINCAVEDETGLFLGRVKEVWQPGPHDVYEIHGPQGSLMVPAVDEFIVKMDIDRQIMVIKVPEVHGQT